MPSGPIQWEIRCVVLVLCWAALRSSAKSLTFSGLNGKLRTTKQKIAKKLRNRMAGSHQVLVDKHALIFHDPGKAGLWPIHLEPRSKSNRTLVLRVFGSQTWPCVHFSPVLRL